MATWSYAEALRELEDIERRVDSKQSKEELKLVEKVTKRTVKRLDEYFDFYGHDPQEEFLEPHRHQEFLPSVNPEILEEAVSFEAASLSEVDCDDWELEQRMRPINFRPNWFLKWLFEHGMYVP